eukprot:TRINITY_DN105910_c0_g1_i1.p1 TRINITY_DN105910_c0_g1~~TRINITY_DN105910_c0_g1_i1.p1  ORF type:complete len:450 (-),score=75.62 TRINITY_DN105910_c0_g1_i1:34-1383(-)
MLSPGHVGCLLLVLLPALGERLTDVKESLSASSSTHRKGSLAKPLTRAPSMLQAKSTLKKTAANSTDLTDLALNGSNATELANNQTLDAQNTLNEPGRRSQFASLPPAPLTFLQEDSTAQQEENEFPVDAPEAAPELLHGAQQVLPLLMPVSGIVAGVRRWQLGIIIGGLSLLAAAVVCVACLCRRHRPAASRLCQEVEKIRVSRGADLQSMFKLSSAVDGPCQPLRPGILTRVEGRVVTDQSAGGSLAAPFSGSECVYYSASVSQQRHDSIHQPPLAFHSSDRDFVIEVKDAPHVRINVSGSDVALFSMKRGLREWQQAFAEAPKSWCSFVLEHLVPSTDASMHFKKCIDLGSDGVALEFRECALLADSSITCVGEVFRDERGNLQLVPWQPQLAELDVGNGKTSKPWLQRAVPWLEGQSGWRKALGSADCLVGNVLVSDSLVQGMSL